MTNVLVTGSSSGFGELIVRTLLRKGYTVAATMREPQTRNAQAVQRLQRVAAETPGALHIFELDVTGSASVNRAVEQANTAMRGIQVAVNNAGYGLGGFMETVTDDQLQHQFDVNVFGVQRVMRAVLPVMRQARKGLIINISSIMGRITLPFAAAYTASKYALEGLSESYRYELAATGVDVVIVEPGGFGTNFMANMLQGKDEARLDSYGDLTRLPDEFWGGVTKKVRGEAAPNPQDVADAVANLIEMPSGRRPLRTVVDPLLGGEGPRAINRTTDEIQAMLLSDMGLKDLLTVKSEQADC
jgi:NAD(P)-dependent dehydrogenase (short-subunit alcohol dehydrogenase family)